MGIQTALAVVKRQPTARVVVLERGLMPTGASTRNAGFACIGSVSEVAADLVLLGTDAAVEIVRRRYDGLRRLLETCAGYDVGFVRDGGHEIFLEDHPSIERIDELNELLRPITGATTFEQRDDLVANFGFSPKVKHLVGWSHQRRAPPSNSSGTIREVDTGQGGRGHGHQVRACQHDRLQAPVYDPAP